MQTEKKTRRVADWEKTEYYCPVCRSTLLRMSDARIPVRRPPFEERDPALWCFCENCSDMQTGYRVYHIDHLGGGEPNE